MSVPDCNWDFSKLPDSEHQAVIDLLQQGKLWDLVKIHNKYSLSINVYCCSNTLPGIKTWFEYGINTGQIRAQVPSEVQTDGAEAGKKVSD
jgi:hypothetical protein